LLNSDSENTVILFPRSLRLVLTSCSDGGEYPRAFVVRKEGLVTEEELVNMIKTRFAPHKWLTGGLYFIDEIPKTGSGKVIRRSLSALDPKELKPRARL
jgi:acyl-coenzyme A synthetase/AMP-(fatty) acid ligase